MNGFLRSLTGLCLIRLVMELVMPEGEIRRYADLGLGLIQILHMLGALNGLTGGWL